MDSSDNGRRSVIVYGRGSDSGSAYMHIMLKLLHSFTIITCSSPYKQDWDKSKTKRSIKPYAINQQGDVLQHIILTVKATYVLGRTQ